MEIIAEIGYNHNGNIETAKALIDAATAAGADTVKLQKTDIESVEGWKTQLYNSPHSYGRTYYEHRKHLEFNIEQILELKEYAEKYNIKFLCSAKDFNSALLLSKHLQHIKLPSQMLRNEDIFYLLHSKGKYVYVSTGMWTEDEVETSKWFDHADVLLHCVSVYPAHPDTCNLSIIRKYKTLRDGIVGYSSHEVGALAVPYAVAAGAEVVERHFTLNHDMKGSDHATVSSTPDEFAEMVQQIGLAVEFCGTGKKFLTADEVEVRKRWVGHGVYNS